MIFCIIFLFLLITNCRCRYISVPLIKSISFSDKKGDVAVILSREGIGRMGVWLIVWVKSPHL